MLFYFIKPFLSEERETSYIEILCESENLNLVFSGVLNYILKSQSVITEFLVNLYSKVGFGYNRMLIYGTFTLEYKSNFGMDIYEALLMNSIRFYSNVTNRLVGQLAYKHKSYNF